MVSDQARHLRGLVEQHQQWGTGSDTSGAAALSIAVTSGKGGVGTSSIALNLAIALGQLNVRAALIDASLGLGHIDLMCGLNGYWNLEHVLAGSRRLDDVTLDGPSGIHVVPGGGAMTARLPITDSDAFDTPRSPGHDTVRQLVALEANHDVLLLDASGAGHPFVFHPGGGTNIVILVTTPEPTSLADAYATIKSLPRHVDTRLMILVNRVESARKAGELYQRLLQTTRLFLESEPTLAGWIPDDPEVGQAIRQRTPLLIQAENSPAARAISQLASRLLYQTPRDPEAPGVFQRLYLQDTRAQEAA